MGLQGSREELDQILGKTSQLQKNLHNSKEKQAVDLVAKGRMWITVSEDLCGWTAICCRISPPIVVLDSG